MPRVPKPNLIERRLSRFLREPVSVRSAVSVIVVATVGDRGRQRRGDQSP
jgi:hypothetical protein